VNYECPEDDMAYLHRIGRTGRAGRTGVAVTFVDWRDLQRWKIIDETLGLGHPEPAETYSTSDHLFTALNIPSTAKGILPRAQRARAGLEAEDLEDIGETGKIRSQTTRNARGAGSATGAPRDREPARRGQRIRRRTRSGAAIGSSQDSQPAATAGAAPDQDAGPGGHGRPSAGGRRRHRSRKPKAADGDAQ
jgi:superfamily II DNA/RNA helicase